MHPKSDPETNYKSHSRAVCVFGTDRTNMKRSMINVRPLKVCPVGTCRASIVEVWLVTLLMWSPRGVHKAVRLNTRAGGPGLSLSFRNLRSGPDPEGVIRHILQGFPGPPGPARPQKRTGQNPAMLPSGTQFQKPATFMSSEFASGAAFCTFCRAWPV